MRTEGVEKTPQRRCVACRCNGKKVFLLRFSVFQNRLCFDLRQKLPGRGYYVCARRECLEKSFSQVLKRQTKCEVSEIAPDVSTFIEEIALPGLTKRAKELLLAGFRSHQLVLGAEGVEQAARANELLAYVLATDASALTAQKYETNAQRKGIDCVTLFDRSFYGALFGKADKVVLGWFSGDLGDQFLTVARAIENLSERTGQKV